MAELKSYLMQYIEERNQVRALMHQQEWDINIPEHRYQINEALTIDLNPEVMTCDGEASEEFVAFRKYYLLHAKRELAHIDAVQVIMDSAYRNDNHLG